MKRLISLSILSIILVSCTGGIPPESSRPPKGNPNGVVVIKEYSDFECPACSSVHKGVVGPIMEEFSNEVRFEFKHFPLRAIHRFAMDAAESSECASDQGKFWEFVDLAFENQNELSYDSLLSWADQLGLNVEQFERCWKSHAKRKVVLADYEEGRGLDVAGTPTFFVNGKKVQVGYDTLKAAIDEELKKFQQRL